MGGLAGVAGCCVRFQGAGVRVNGAPARAAGAYRIGQRRHLHGGLARRRTTGLGPSRSSFCGTTPCSLTDMLKMRRAGCWRNRQGPRFVPRSKSASACSTRHKARGMLNKTWARSLRRPHPNPRARRPHARQRSLTQPRTVTPGPLKLTWHIRDAGSSCARPNFTRCFVSTDLLPPRASNGGRPLAAHDRFTSPRTAGPSGALARKRWASSNGLVSSALVMSAGQEPSRGRSR